MKWDGGKIDILYREIEKINSCFLSFSSSASKQRAKETVKNRKRERERESETILSYCCCSMVGK